MGGVQARDPRGVWDRDRGRPPGLCGLPAAEAAWPAGWAAVPVRLVASSTAEQLEGLHLQAGEILQCRFVDLDEAARLLRGPVRRRVLAAVGTDRCLYLEDGRPVDSVRA